MQKRAQPSSERAALITSIGSIGGKSAKAAGSSAMLQGKVPLVCVHYGCRSSFQPISATNMLFFRSVELLIAAPPMWQTEALSMRLSSPDLSLA